MNWTDQMQELTRSWVEAQRKMASDWSTAATGFAGAAGQPDENPLSRLRETASKNLENWLKGMGGVPGDVAQRMYGGAQTYYRFFDFITEGLRKMAPQMEQGTAWADAMKNYLEAAKEKMSAQPTLWMKPETAAALGGDMKELWTLYLGQAKAMAAPWAQSMEDARGHLGEAMAGDHRAMIRTFNLFTDTFESTLGRCVGAPAIGYSREYQEKMMKAFDSWVEVRKAEAALNVELVNIGFRAMQALVGELQQKAQQGEKIENPRKLFDLWVNTAEKHYYDATRTESFAKVQAALVNSAMHYRVHERTLMEVYQKAFHLPTRGELDDAYKHMHELRKQVKKLTKAAAGQQDQLREQQAAFEARLQKELDAQRAQFEEKFVLLEKQPEKKIATLERQQERKIATLERQQERKVAALERQTERKVVALEKKLEKLTLAQQELKKAGTAARATRTAAKAAPKATAATAKAATKTPSTRTKAAPKASGTAAKSTAKTTRATTKTTTRRATGTKKAAAAAKTTKAKEG